MLVTYFVLALIYFFEGPRALLKRDSWLPDLRAVFRRGSERNGALRRRDGSRRRS